MSDSGGKPVYVFDSERFFRRIQQLVQADIRTVSDSFFTDNTAVSGTAYMADKYALGLGIMLSASEVPRIAQQFGLDTSIRFNMVSVSSTVNTAMRAGKFVTSKFA